MLVSVMRDGNDPHAMIGLTIVEMDRASQQEVEKEPQEEYVVNLAVNEFAKRHTADSKFAHYEGNWDELVELTWANYVMGNWEEGYKDGVVLVNVLPEGFKSSIIKVDADVELNARFTQRREGEMPYVEVTSPEHQKDNAKKVQIVLYRKDVLAENDENSTDAEWEIVSINASPTEEDTPMTPLTMARNFLELPGGTKGEYTAEEFAKSIVFWSQHVMVW